MTRSRPRPVRGLLFLALAYGGILWFALTHLRWARRDPDGAFAAAHAWCRFVRRAARALVGIETEVRGTPPTGEALVAAKHQSFLDIALIFGALPRARFIMKAELTRAPGLGWYGLRMGCIPVDRGARGAAVRQMLADVEAGRQRAGQIIIYAQGTRTPPGARPPYKKGTAALYQDLGQPCVPVACNVGLFWPAHGALFRPGLAVVEFLPPIPPGLTNEAFMARLEGAIEPASDRLMAEAGFRTAGSPPRPG
jgi:1-acyl-sn-glycerol-3-phosphate acyltransferase